VDPASRERDGLNRLIEAMAELMVGRPRDALVFTAPEGGPVSDSHFRNRVWKPVIKAAGVRKLPPRFMRHTAASWLVPPVMLTMGL
jgi:site-specific recombinase XerD